MLLKLHTIITKIHELKLHYSRYINEKPTLLINLK